MSGNILLSEWRGSVLPLLVETIKAADPLLSVEIRNGDLRVRNAGATVVVNLDLDPQGGRRGRDSLVPRIAVARMAGTAGGAPATVLAMIALQRRVIMAVQVARVEVDSRGQWPDRVYIRDCPCGRCGGRGKVHAQDCKNCNGTGVLNDEDVA